MGRNMVNIGEYLNFKPIKEDWNLYVLEENVLLKIKLVLIKVLLKDIDEVGNPGYETNYQSVIGIVPPAKVTGKPSGKTHTRMEILDSIIKDDINVIKTIQEDWNEYELSDGAKLSVKLVLTKVSKTKLFDKRGEPIYHVEWQVIMKGNIPKGLRLGYRKRYEQIREGKSV